MTSPVDPVEALTARVASLEKELATLKAQLRERVTPIAQFRRHLADHAASGYDFRRVQADSKNENPPEVANGYET